MLGSQDEAEDAVQQAFVSAHRDMQRNARELNFKPWLYTVARNRCLSMLRARREQASELSEGELSTAGLQDEVEQRSDLRELVADVQRLPEEQRAALVLSEVGDLSHREVAEVLGVQPLAVKGLVFRARSALIERRDARNTDCQEIREELSVAKGGALRRSHLRYHLEGCPSCAAYLEEVRRQRKLLGLALPVVPTLALHDSVMASAGIGAAASAGAVGAAAGGGVAATAAVPLLGGTIAKVAVVGVLAVSGAGVASEVVRDDGGSQGGADVQQAPADESTKGSGQEAGPPSRAGKRSYGVRGAERRRRGWRRAGERSDGRTAAGSPRGRARGRSGDRPGLGKGRDRGNAGKAVGRGGTPPAKPPQAKSPAKGGAEAPPGAVVPKGSGEAGGKKPAPTRVPPETSSAPEPPLGQLKIPAAKK